MKIKVDTAGDSRNATFFYGSMRISPEKEVQRRVYLNGAEPGRVLPSSLQKPEGFPEKNRRLGQRAL